jgi:hypothetical protein
VEQNMHLKVTATEQFTGQDKSMIVTAISFRLAAAFFTIHHGKNFTNFRFENLV